MPRMRRFEFVGGTSSKFWEISQSGPQVTVRFGRIGTDGQTQTKDLGTWDDASERVRKLIAEKLREGYQEVAGTGPKVEDEPGFRTAPMLPPYEIPQLPGDGPVRLGEVKLPMGRWLGGNPEFAPSGVSPIDKPVLWATNDRVKDAGRSLFQLRQPAAARNLVPVLLVGMDGAPERPWDSREFCPTDPRRAGLIDVAAELANAWSGNFEDDDEELMASVSPLGKKFPGLAAPQASWEQVSDDAELLERIRDRRVGLVAAGRPADTIAAIGWTGMVNHLEDPALLSAVLRSWEVRWNAFVVEIGFDTLTLTVGNPPRDEQAATVLAAEHCAFCPDNIWQGVGTISAYARELAQSRWWHFWWD